jgi:hypothetical protein
MGNPHGGLDEEIEQLLQCKPLAEPKVPLSSPHTAFEFWVFDSAGPGGFWRIGGRQAGWIRCLPFLNRKEWIFGLVLGCW